jgi:antigen 43
MGNTTYTWTATAPSGTLSANWTTGSDWTPVPTAADFTLAGGGLTSDYLIDLSANLSLSGFGGGQVVDGLTVDDSNATLTFSSSQFTVNDLTLFDGLIVATADAGELTIGTSTNAGTLELGSGGTVQVGSSDDSSGYLIDGKGSAGPAQITGSGTILATGGFGTFGPNIEVTGGVNIDIANNGDGANAALVFFEGNVEAGTVSFLGGSGLLIVGGSQIGNGIDLSNGSFGATIAGLTAAGSFTNGIDIADGSTVVSAALSGTDNDTLTVTDNHSDTVRFTLSGNYTGDTAAVQSDTLAGGGYDVYLLVCYGIGTAILTDRGEVAVEDIQRDDAVMTLVDGALVPQMVKWVGHRDLDLTRQPNADSLAPIRIMRGALGDNLPKRDLIVSPDHCLFFEGGLYPAKLLINDMTIVQDLSAKTVSYYHIELERHSVIVAEGVAAESYLDTGNRAFFSNAGLATILHPELNINENLRCWNTDACAPLMVRPEAVKPVWQRIADRAKALGYKSTVHATTKDAGIHLMVDGKVVRPLASKGKTVSFMVPAHATSIRLMSRATRQSALTPWLDDPRTLGVAIRSVTLRDQAGETILSADHPALRDGWHAAEHAADGAVWRWSAGDAVLPIKSSGAFMMDITLSETATYVEDAARLAA